jgi:hypothetical protein
MFFAIQPLFNPHFSSAGRFFKYLIALSLSLAFITLLWPDFVLFVEGNFVDVAVD